MLNTITQTIQARLTGTCIGYELEPGDLEACRLIETLRDRRPCPFQADSADADRTTGWQIDLGLVENDRRRCEILPADDNNDGCPDGPCDCEGGDYEGCLQGWFYRREAPPCSLGRIEITSSSNISDESQLSFECALPECPE